MTITKTPVYLNYWEAEYACSVGSRRHLESCFSGRKARFPERTPDELLLHHQHGALGELAFCKLVNRYWGGHINRFHEADVGEEVEVRWSARNDLKIRSDDTTKYIVSMSGALTDTVKTKQNQRVIRFYYNGYITPQEGQKQEWQQDFGNHGAPAFFVPHSHLDPAIPPSFLS